MDQDITFVSLEDALQIHEHAIEQYGGMHGVRDGGLLESALGQPKAMAFGQFLHEDIAAMAAAYLFSVVKNHPFLDGNKRAGAAIAYVFLQLNGYDLSLAEEEFEALVLRVAQGAASKDEVAGVLRGHRAENQAE